MKIAIKFSPSGYSGGSANTFALHLVKAIHQESKDIELFAQIPEVFSNVAGLSIEKTSNPFLQETLFKKITTWIYQQWSFESTLLKRSCDVLYCPYNNEALFHTRKIPQIITVHDLIPLLYPEDFKITSALWKYVHIPAIQNARAVITVSYSTKRDLLRFCNITEDKIFVVPIGFSNLTQYSDEDSSVLPFEDPYILYVCSSQYPYKNLERLFEAYKTLSKSFPHKLVIVGKPVPRFTSNLNNFIVELNLQDKITFLSDLSNADLATIYRKADLFVYPSLYEGFGIPPLEAMACNVPVVASNASSIPEVCGDAALYIDPYSVEDLVSGMTRGLVDLSLREKLVIAGNDRVKLFKWEKTAQGVLEVCKKVLESD